MKKMTQQSYMWKLLAVALLVDALCQSVVGFSISSVYGATSSVSTIRSSSSSSSSLTGSVILSEPTHTTLPPPTTDLKVSFSHIHLYVDRIQPLEVYKDLEAVLNEYDAKLQAESKTNPTTIMSLDRRQELWKNACVANLDEDGIRLNGIWSSSSSLGPFIPQKRDVIQQLLVGFGFRVTGGRLSITQSGHSNTDSLLVTSRDLSGVQIVVTAKAGDEDSSGKVDESSTDTIQEEYCSHFDTANVDQFLTNHADRQGIAVLGFQANDVECIRQRYGQLHPNLIHSYREYPSSDSSIAATTKVLEVYAYYEKREGSISVRAARKRPDRGTILRFIEGIDATTETSSSSSRPPVCILPGLAKVDAEFDTRSQPAYCDHWVSNVFSRTEFLETLEETLGFAPKVDFNAGVVAAGEAQIESTVLGNASPFETGDRREALQDQSQVYLPINNALSSVGHVHGFLQEIGQGIQHVASRVDNLVEFVQGCNDMRKITGEGFTFLDIPRSYYGTLSLDHLVSAANISIGLAESILSVCEETRMVADDSSVDLTLSREEIAATLESSDLWTKEQRQDYLAHKDDILRAILTSRFRNLYSLLRDQISEEVYMGIVRNQILVDVQGEDILYQIFTCNVLQRQPGEEAPFFEFIQRVCSECQTVDGYTATIKPGCGGFGIRNFLTLFLSIEVSKAMLEVSEAKATGDESRCLYAQKRVDCFTSQLNDSNPILTEISDAMTEEGNHKSSMEAALLRDEDDKAAQIWEEKMVAASKRKQIGNAKLMECSAKYEMLMRSIREAVE